MHFLSEDLERYVEQHTQPEPELLAKLNRETWQKVINPRMLSGHLQGRALSMFSKMIQPMYVLEIGTYTGYSALCFAEGLREGGKVVTIDINDELQSIQDKYFSASPFAAQIERHFGNALDIIPALTYDFDLVFLDADKENYLNYYHMLIPRMKSGSYIMVDNVLWNGKVLHPASPKDVDTRVMQELNALMTRDERIENVLLPLRDGLMIGRVK
ncbi:MAG TPA: O-methyltransferase [Flavobacteriales bacterium]